MLSNDLELEINVLRLQGKLKEVKQEKEKIEDKLITVIVTFIFCAGASLFLFFSKVKVESWITPSFSILAIIFLLFWLLFWNKYKKKKTDREVRKGIKEAERGVKRLSMFPWPNFYSSCS